MPSAPARTLVSRIFPASSRSPVSQASLLSSFLSSEARDSPPPAPKIPAMVICPSGFSSSSGRNSRIVPYSPSKPGSRVTSPFLRRRIPSAARRPKWRRISSMGTSRRISNSVPSTRSISRYSSCTRLLAADLPVEAAITSGSGTRLSKGFLLSGRKPSGRSAS
ncbi:unknown [Clostridium sp. CAG:58]|nr:unknown [Clostridium sp. CAG:58]